MKSFFFLQHFVYGKQCAIMREKELCDGGKKNIGRELKMQQQDLYANRQ